MTPELQQLRQEVEELKRLVNSLFSSASLPHDLEQAIKIRLKINTFTPLTTSSKVTNSENQAVDEAGMASYKVLKGPDGWDERNDNGTIKYYPFWN